MQEPIINLKIDKTSRLLKYLDFQLSAFYFLKYENNLEEKVFIIHNYRLIVINSGRFESNIDNTKFILEPGDIVVLSYHQKYVTKPLEKNSSIYYFDFGLSDPNNNSEFENLIHLNYKFVYKNIILKWQLDNLYYLERCVNINFPGAYLFAESTLLRMFIVIIKYFTENNIPLIPKSENAKSRLLHTCIDYINAHITEPIKIKDMAEELNYSENYIYKIFKELMNMSCQDYILEIRLNNALKDLITSNKSISAVAQDNGFNSLYHFSKSFKNKYGYSPNNLRKIKEKQI